LRQPERRFLPRVDLEIPMRLRHATKATPEQACQTINVSVLGAYFSVDVALKVGELVQVLIELPKKVTGKQTAHYCFTARVVHVEPDGPAQGKHGVGVNFYSYERLEESKRRE
jgi:PilZ domain